MKVLISSGFGAGWTTWHYGPKEEVFFLLTHQPTIAVLERGEKLTRAHYEKCVEDLQAAFPEADAPYDGGYYKLCVHDVPAGTSFRVEEYDGAESIQYRDQEDWYIAT